MAIEHSPYKYTKEELKQSITNLLYGNTMDKLANTLNNIIIRNCLLMNYTHHSVSYKGKLYNVDILIPPKKQNRLAASLREEMDSYLSEVKQLQEEEIPIVLGYVNQVLNLSDRSSDYKKLFPEFLHGILKDTNTNYSNKSFNTIASFITPDVFLKCNTAAINLMKNRMMINLLV